MQTFENMSPLIISAIFLVYVLSVVIGLIGVFRKAGRPGILALVPLYNIFVIVKIVHRPVMWSWILVLCMLSQPGDSPPEPGPIPIDAGPQELRASARDSFEYVLLFTTSGALTNFLAGFMPAPIQWLLAVLVLGVWLIAPVLGLCLVFDLSASFGKGVWYGFGILALPFVFFLNLGFGNPSYQHKA